jgi:calcineurin-like phosphoesterase family protein
MATRYYTSDLHFGSSVLLDKKAMLGDARPFDSLYDMHVALLKAMSIAKKDDVIIHLGDLAGIGKDREWEGITKTQAKALLDSIDCTKIFIEGNHDICNDVYPTAGKLLIEQIGGHMVTMQHYPSDHCEFIYVDLYSKLTYKGQKVIINICGHVHNLFKVWFDDSRNVLNINVGIDKNKFKLYSEADLNALISNAEAYLKCLEDDETLSYDMWFKHYMKEKNADKHIKRIKSAQYKLMYKPWLLADKEKRLLESLEVSKKLKTI